MSAGEEGSQELMRLPAVGDDVVAGGTGAGTRKRKRLVQEPSRMLLRLHLMLGSFVSGVVDDDGSTTRGAGGGGGGHLTTTSTITMDAEVWSKMPEELMWEVVLRMPAVKHFQLQRVSPKWREVLTSTHFRNKFKLMATAAAAGSREQQQEQRVVACVPNCGGAASTGSPRRGWKSKELKLSKVVDIELSGLVPKSFWANSADPNSYRVVAAGDGLVWIASSDKDRPAATQHAVLNPLTRTCIVLPPHPFPEHFELWYPPTSCTSSAGCVTVWGMSISCWDKATYHLPPPSAGCGGAGWVVTARCRDRAYASPPPRLGDRTYRYCMTSGRLHVLEPAGPGGGGGGGDGLGQVEVAALDTPSSLTLRRPRGRQLWVRRDEYSTVVAIRGAVYYVAQLAAHRSADRNVAACGVWRLAGAAADVGRMQWEEEPVAILDGPEVARLTGLATMSIQVYQAYAVRELLCCHLIACSQGVFSRCCLVALNLDTGKWAAVHGEEEGMEPITAMELRPDFFCPRLFRDAWTVLPQLALE